MARGPDKGWLGRDSGGRLVEASEGIPVAPSSQSKADGLWSFASAPSAGVSGVLNRPQTGHQKRTSNFESSAVNAARGQVSCPKPHADATTGKPPSRYDDS